MSQHVLTFELPERPDSHGPYIVIPHLHRRPPKPPWFMREEPGTCRWCQKTILDGQRKNPRASLWHMECLHEYNILFDWPTTRKAIMERDKSICASCGLDAGREFHVDHIRPLHQWPARDLAAQSLDSFSEWYAPWLLTNLQTLCVDCHKAKTGQEATRRAAE